MFKKKNLFHFFFYSNHSGCFLSGHILTLNTSKYTKIQDYPITKEMLHILNLVICVMADSVPEKKTLKCSETHRDLTGTKCMPWLHKVRPVSWHKYTYILLQACSAFICEFISASLSVLLANMTSNQFWGGVEKGGVTITGMKHWEYNTSALHCTSVRFSKHSAELWKITVYMHQPPESASSHPSVHTSNILEAYIEFKILITLKKYRSHQMNIHESKGEKWESGRKLLLGAN